MTQNNDDVFQIHAQTIYCLVVYRYNTNMEEKQALIFGGTSGIGKELACMLSERGMRVTVTGTTCCASDLPSQVRVLSVAAEQLMNAEMIPSSSLDEFYSILDACDLLCVSYGPFVSKPVHQTSLAEWKTVGLYDYALPGMLVSRALNGMIKRKYGRILLFGGTRTDTIRPCKTNAAYAGAKTGLSVLVKSVAACYSDSNITCNAVLPGFVTSVPEGQESVSAVSVAREALHLLDSKDLNGNLVTVGNTAF